MSPFREIVRYRDLFEKVMAKIKRLYKELYRGFNITHFTEKLNEVEGIRISRETVRKHLRAHNLIG